MIHFEVLKIKENTYIERSHRSDEKEFYQQDNIYSILSTMQEKIKEWEVYLPHYLDSRFRFLRWKSTFRNCCRGI